jgi:hypothetical protein
MSWTGLLESAWEGWKEVEALATTAEQAYQASNNLFMDSGTTRSGKRFRNGDMVPQSNVRRRFVPNDPDPSMIPLPDSSDSSLSNNPQPPDIPDMPDRAHQVQGTRGHTDEVEVMPHHGPMSKIIEDYHTINLTFFQRFIKFSDNPGGFTTYVFRLNSIYDCDETTGGTQQPLGRDTWAAIYQYYRVLSCNMEVKIINRNNTNTLLAGIVLEEDTSNLTDTRNNFMMRKNAIRAIIPGNQYASGSIGQLTFDYNPSQWDHHVQETGIEERWTPISETPSNNHKAVLRFIMSDGSALGTTDDADQDFEFFVTMRYTVQFREANKTILTTGSIA